MRNQSLPGSPGPGMPFLSRSSSGPGVSPASSSRVAGSTCPGSQESINTFFLPLSQENRLNNITCKRKIFNLIMDIIDDHIYNYICNLFVIKEIEFGSNQSSRHFHNSSSTHFNNSNSSLFPSSSTLFRPISSASLSSSRIVNFRNLQSFLLDFNKTICTNDI